MNERYFSPVAETTREYLEKQELSIDGIKTEADVESVAWSVLEEDEYAKYLIERIETARVAGREDERSIRERANLLNEIRVEVALISGVEIDAVEHVRQKKDYRNRIAKKIGSIDINTSHEELMEELGIITPVSGRRGHIFTFPTDILPPYVHEQWEVYMGMVEQFEAAANNLRRGVISQTEFSGIDLMRKKAHNTVSQSIGDILQFTNWEHEDYRNFVAKMRDKKFDEKKGEVARYAGAFINEFTATSEHLSVMSKKIRNRR